MICSVSPAFYAFSLTLALAGFSSISMDTLSLLPLAYTHTHTHTVTIVERRTEPKPEKNAVEPTRVKCSCFSRVTEKSKHKKGQENAKADHMEREKTKRPNSTGGEQS